MHFCAEELAMILALIPGASFAVAKLRARWLTRHQCSQSCPHDASPDCEESAHTSYPHHHAPNDNAAGEEGRSERGAKDATGQKDASVASV
jgi:hypothetical protein